jgi:UDP-2,3-diacylglucosamine pyrophosphatase LpxH
MNIEFDLISDLHLQSFSTYLFPNLKPSSEILAVLGDVCEIDQIQHLTPFFRYISKNWKHVFYVPGNHEFYCGYLEDTVSLLKSELQDFKNIKVLDNDSVLIDNTVFVGSTLWSHMDNDNPVSKLICKRTISDYRYIRKSLENKKLITPNDTVELFNKNLKFIQDMVYGKGHDSFVVLTHHAPSYSCIDDKYIGEKSNGAFVSNLDNFIFDNPQIKVWAYGHCHTPKDFNIHKCRIVSNPKGYSGENMKDNNYTPLKVEVSE